jgi:hypothetical protein
VIPLAEGRLRAVLGWVVTALLVGPVTGSVLLGVLHGDSPCILCWAERTSMILIALVGLFVIRYGPKPRYLGMAILLATWGTFMAIRHSGLHLARDVGQGFSVAILGVHTYVWAWVIHATVLATIGTLLLGVHRIEGADELPEPSGAGRFAMGLFTVVVATNALQAFASTGPPPFIGQADPVRLSLDPRRWVWSMEELQPPRVSLRGAWAIPIPSPEAADPDPAHGPLAGLTILPVLEWERVNVPIEGALSGLARDSSTGRFLAVTDRYGVYVLDGTLTRVVHRVVLDPGFSVDLTPLVGAAFLGGDTLAVLSRNKSYALLAADPGADEHLEWRHFLATDGGVRQAGLGRFQTVRAHQMYVSSFAFDPSSRELITVGVPSPRHRQLVVSRFARKDMLLSSEFEPELGEGLALKGPDRNLSEYQVTGATVRDGHLYVISAAFSTLLVIDLASTTVRDAYAVSGLARPVGLASRGPELLVAEADGRIGVIEPPQP